MLWSYLDVEEMYFSESVIRRLVHLTSKRLSRVRSMLNKRGWTEPLTNRTVPL